MNSDGVRYLVIVSRTEPDLYNYLRRAFSGDKKVQVFLDRRQGQRRQRVQPYEPERRRADRRRQRSLDEDLRFCGSVLTRTQRGSI